MGAVRTARLDRGELEPYRIELCLRSELPQTPLADRRIVSLLDQCVLCADMNVTQPALQRRGIVHGSAASQCEPRVDKLPQRVHKDASDG